METSSNLSMESPDSGHLIPAVAVNGLRRLLGRTPLVDPVRIQWRQRIAEVPCTDPVRPDPFE
jgi:hypothetical protein